MSNRRTLVKELMGTLYASKQAMHAKMTAGKKWPITLSQQLVLFLIFQSPTIGIKGIARPLCISSSAATQLVNELVKDGYAVRKTNSKDRRELDLFISPKGRRLVIAAMRKHTAIMEDLFKPLSDRELKVFVELNKKIVSNIKQHA